MKFEIVKTNANDVKLTPDLYAAAYDNGYSFTQLLENIDPTPLSGPGSELDAFERQLMRFGIQTKNDPKRGISSSRGDLFFQSNQPEARILFPEFLNRVARVAVMAQDDILNQLVTGMETISDNGIYRALYIDDTAAQRKTYRAGERGAFPVTKISWSEKATTLAKYGVTLEMSYEFVRRATLPLISLLIGRIMLEVRVDEITEAINALLLGDGSGHSSGGAIASTNLSSYQGGSPGGIKDMSYAGYLGWLYAFWPGACSTVIGNPKGIVGVLTVPKPTVDPIFLYSLLDKSVLGGQPRLINGRLSDNVGFVIHDSIADDILLGIDNRYALIGYREAGTDLTETNKIINGQWNEIVISNTIGFQTLFASARKKLVTNA
jgi:hypothetical protein